MADYAAPGPCCANKTGLLKNSGTANERESLSVGKALKKTGHDKGQEQMHHSY
jgi:hypothetical protein